MGRFTALSPHGQVIVTMPDGPAIERDTKQCVHCGMHWVIKPGSGRPHVFCRKCGGDTCSNLACLRECIPVEKLLEEYGGVRPPS